MAELTTALQAALAAQRPLFFGAVEINLPGYDLCLIDGSGELMIGGKKFVGRDPTYGVLDSVKGISDSIGDQAPSITLGLIPASDVALSALVDPNVQGSTVTMMVGAIDMATGLAIPDPYAIVVGELDVPSISWGKNDRRLEYKIGTIADRLFQTEEGRRLSDGFHQKVWPGELGLAFVTDVETWVPWGQKLNTTVIETRTNVPSMGQITYNRT